MKGGNHNLVDVLIGQGKFSLSSSRLFHSLSSGTLTDLHVIVRSGTVAAAQANLHIANRKRNISVVGAFSRAISLPSVSGSSFQACGYQVDCLLSEPSSHLGTNSQKAIMAICGSRSALTDCSATKFSKRRAQPSVAAYHSFCTFSRNCFDSCRRANMSWRNKEQPNNFLLYSYFIYNVAKRKGNGNPFLGFNFEGLHISSSACSSADTASDVSIPTSEMEEQSSTSTDSSERYVHFCCVY